MKKQKERDPVRWLLLANVWALLLLLCTLTLLLWAFGLLPSILAFLF